MAIAAKMGDKVIGTDIHIIMVPSPGGPEPTLMPAPVSVVQAVGTVMIGP